MLALLAGTRPTAGAPQDDRPVDDLAVAADGTWPMAGACPARTRATWTRLVTGPMETAWSWSGTAEQEPCVWHDRVVVASYDARGAKLDILRLSDGRPVVPPKVFEGRRRLEPVMWQDYIFVRKDEATFEVLRPVPELAMTSVVATLRTTQAPLVVDGDLILVNGRTLERRRLGAERPIWSASLTEAPDGPLSARDGMIYFVTNRNQSGFVGTEVFVTGHTLDSGLAARPSSLGWYADERGRAAAWVAVGAEELFVFHPDGIQLKDAAPSPASRCYHGGAFPVPFRPTCAPAFWKDRAFLGLDGAEYGRVLLMSGESYVPGDGRTWRWWQLASATRHADFVPADRDHVVAARGLVRTPVGVFDAASQRIVERHARPEEPLKRLIPRPTFAIPARETLLVSRESGFDAMRATTPEAVETQSGPHLPTDGPPAPALAGASVLAPDGGVRTGTATVAGPDATVSVGGKAVAPLAEIGLVVSKDGQILHGPHAPVVARGLPRVARDRSRAAWAAHARGSLASRDVDTVRGALRDLMERGGKVDDVLAIQRELTRLENPSAVALRPDAVKVAEAAKRRASLLAADATVPWTAFTSLPDATPLPYRLDVLRVALAADPLLPAAVAWLRARLPVGLVPPDVVDTQDWVDVIEAASHTTLEVVTPKGAAPASGDEARLLAARATWRPDLVALRSERLLLLTPVVAPGRIAHALALGELVCATLDGMFRLTPDAARTADPLVVLLFETKDEYLRMSRGDLGHGGSAWLASTLGHYSPAEGLSRLYVPKGDDDFESTLSTLAHELTHHWLDRRLPLPAGAKRGYGVDTPGFFLEEGFAVLVEEFLFDLRRRTVTTLDPRANSLDVAATAGPGITWPYLFDMTQAEFRRLPATPEREVPLRWTLGKHRKMTPTNFFYAQAGAVCHYLWEAEGGAHRETLLTWVRDLHAGATVRDDVSRRVGRAATSFGDLVCEWAASIGGR